jgi:uncharacterized protein (TIGR03089 family)
VSEPIATQLQRRIRRSGAAPLITYYEPSAGVRTELSATSFGNWVDKTANLLVDELLLDAGSRIELAVARSHPAHWITAVWELACWQIGAAVVLDRDPIADLVVESAADGVVDATGTIRSDRSRSDAQVVVCSLHPLGLPLPTPPARALDYNLEVRSQPDVFAGPPPAPSALAWVHGDRRFTQADLVAGSGTARRRLLQPSDAWTAAAALIEAIVTGGSVVFVSGPADSRLLSRIATDERAAG